jgi:DNA-directed RNA polymerase sigma subunit (sigma70/sigma32)
MPAHAATALRKLIDAERVGGNTECVDGSSEVVTSAVKHARNEVSLNTTVGRIRHGEQQQRTLADTLVDPMPTPETALLSAELREAVRRGIADLTAPELVALRMRFGLVDASEEDECAAPDA